jgi:hypothetical protein
VDGLVAPATAGVGGTPPTAELGELLGHTVAVGDEQRLDGLPDVLDALSGHDGPRQRLVLTAHEPHEHEPGDDLEE